MCGGDYTRGRNLFIRPQHLVRGYFPDFMPFLQMFSSEDRRGADWVYPDLFLGKYPRMLMSAYEARTDRLNSGPSTIGLHKSKNVNMMILAQSSASCMSYFYSIYDDSSIFKSSLSKLYAAQQLIIIQILLRDFLQEEPAFLWEKNICIGEKSYCQIAPSNNNNGFPACAGAPLNVKDTPIKKIW